jgi:aryl-alcohol dehydrogenase-like predicted oxidoreductase
VLARRYERDARLPLGSRHEAFWAGRQAALTDEVFDAVDQLAEVAAGVGLELHELAHAWVLQQSALTSVIVGPRTLEHLDLALAGVTATLSSDVLAAIDAIVPPGRAVLPQYGNDGMAWTTWGPHRHAWR